MSQLSGLTYEYRPRRLEDFAGNENTIAIMKGKFKANKGLPNVWLFEGESGCGKTTMARWLSMRLNCTEVQDGDVDPCGECDSCTSMMQDPPDHQCHMEINASNQRKLDDMRKFIQKAKYNPLGGKKRVILMDEPQGIIKEGKQALLIPLENPPPNTVWIFSTTDPSQLGTALLGRCEAGRLSFKKVEPKTLAKHMYKICKEEGARVPKSALIRIAEITDGQPRRAIASLDKVIALIAGQAGTMNQKDMEDMVIRAVEDSTSVSPWKASKAILECLLRSNLGGAIHGSKTCDVPAEIILRFMAEDWTQMMYMYSGNDKVDRSHKWWTNKFSRKTGIPNMSVYIHIADTINGALSKAKNHLVNDKLLMASVIFSIHNVLEK